MEFLKKFFTQSNDNDYLISLLGKGEGSFGYRHFIWIAVSIILGILLYQLFKRHKKVGKWFIVIAAISLFSYRLINQTYRAIEGLENPWYAAIPFHLCTVMTFVLPVIALLDVKKLKSAIYGASIMGGVITIIFGEYFDYKFINLSNLEGMIAHMLLIYIPLADIAIDNFHFEFKDWWKTTACMGICCLWATLGNLVIFKGYDKNFMYLRKNALPFNTPIHFFFVYLLIFVIFLLILYGVPTLYRKHKQKSK